MNVMNIRIDGAQKIIIERAQVEVIGLAGIGRGSTSKIDGPGSFSIPAHHLSGVYAGIATHGLKGNKLNKPIPVLLFCNDNEQILNIKTNNCAGSWISSIGYHQVNVESSIEGNMSAA